MVGGGKRDVGLSKEISDCEDVKGMSEGILDCEEVRGVSEGTNQIVKGSPSPLL